MLHTAPKIALPVPFRAFFTCHEAADSCTEYAFCRAMSIGRVSPEKRHSFHRTRRMPIVYLYLLLNV
jgi:hypothetical protein